MVHDAVHGGSIARPESRPGADSHPTPPGQKCKQSTPERQQFRPSIVDAQKNAFSRARRKTGPSKIGRPLKNAFFENPPKRGPRQQIVDGVNNGLKPLCPPPSAGSARPLRTAVRGVDPLHALTRNRAAWTSARAIHRSRATHVMFRMFHVHAGRTLAGSDARGAHRRTQGPSTMSTIPPPKIVDAQKNAFSRARRKIGPSKIGRPLKNAFF